MSRTLCNERSRSGESRKIRGGKVGGWKEERRGEERRTMGRIENVHLSICIFSVSPGK